MKRFFAIAIAVIAAASVQDAVAQSHRMSEADAAKREQLMQTRIGMLKEELKLTDEQSERFEPIYREYRREIAKVSNFKDAHTRKDELTNDNALKVIAARLSNTINTSSVKQRYLYIFAEVLEPLQIERLYRTDDRIAREARKVVQHRGQ